MRSKLRHKTMMCVVLILTTLVAGFAAVPRRSSARLLAEDVAPAAPDQGPQLEQAFGQMPLYFVENQGQVDDRVRYYLQGRDKTLYFTPEGVTFVLRGGDEPLARDDRRSISPGSPLLYRDDQQARQGWVVKLDFMDANPDVEPVGQDVTPAVISYFKGRPDEWIAGDPYCGSPLICGSITVENMP